MSVYDTIRHLADTHGLIVLLALFLTLCLWPFRPGSRKHNRTAAESIFTDQDDGE